MIQVLRGGATVLARMPVPGEDRPARQRSSRAEGDLDVVAEAHDGRRLQGDALRPEDRPVLRDDLGLLLEDEHDRPLRCDHREGLVRGVENERSSHGRSSGRRPRCSEHTTAPCAPGLPAASRLPRFARPRFARGACIGGTTTV